MKILVQKGFHDEVKKASLFFVKDLGIEQSKSEIKVSYMKPSERNYGEVFEQGVLTKRYLIKIDKALTLTEVLRTLAHEMIHIQQMELKQLQNFGTMLYWKGKTYSRDIPYKEKPWEIDAHSRHDYLLMRYVNDGQYKTKLETNLPWWKKLFKVFF